LLPSGIEAQGLLLDRNLGGAPLLTDLEMHRMALDEQKREAKSQSRNSCKGEVFEQFI
jgi:hypothetical protein